jgi:hypothetical protein
MAKQRKSEEAFAKIRKAGTAAPNFDLDTDDIIRRLTRWQSLCGFTVTGAKGDTVDIRFETLPADMDAFVRDLYDFCPDLVDQGTGCVHEFVDAAGEDELPPAMRELIEGIDFEDEDYGLEILKREVTRDRRVSLWWD